MLSTTLWNKSDSLLCIWTLQLWAIVDNRTFYIPIGLYMHAPAHGCRVVQARSNDQTKFWSSTGDLSNYIFTCPRCKKVYAHRKCLQMLWGAVWDKSKALLLTTLLIKNLIFIFQLIWLPWSDRNRSDFYRFMGCYERDTSSQRPACFPSGFWFGFIFGSFGWCWDIYGQLQCNTAARLAKKLLPARMAGQPWISTNRKHGKSKFCSRGL